MRWKILNKEKPKSQKELLQILLNNRGFTTKKEVTEFLNPIKPDKLTKKDVGISALEIHKAIKIIFTAIKNNELIVVYGDYDCDGICATAILWETLYALGAKAMPYIPDRVEDGYGLSVSGLDKLKKALPEAKLIITVDHGIVAVKQTQYANKLGLGVIITDHHTVGKKLPKALAIVHTTKLSGSGVSWFLSNQLVYNHQVSANSQKLTANSQLDLAALGTIADMVPLTFANRCIAKHGLAAINNTKRIGLLALINEAGIIKDKIGTYEIGFILAPRLNALGRIDNAMDALRLLCTKDKEKATKLANRLNLINLERQKLTEETTLHAKINSQLTTHNKKLIFISNEAYNQGVIGLAAGRLVEEFYRPTIVVSKGRVFSKASARSISGFNIVEAIRSCAELLVDVGGHPMAAGFTVETEKLVLLEEKLQHFATQNIKDEDLIKTLKVDCELPLDLLSVKIQEEIASFKPFGMQNPEPVFFCEAEIVETRLVGNSGKHLKLKIKPISKNQSSMTNNQSPISNDQFNAIAFNFLNYSKMLKNGDKISLAYTIEMNEWNGERNLQLKVKDILITNNK